MRAGLDFSQLVTFDDGAPDGDISWALYRLDGTEVATGAITPEDGAVSAVLVVAGTYNQLSTGTLRNVRELAWTYTVGGDIRSGRVEYTVEGRVPFPVSPRGAREKLGVGPQDLPDDEVDLIGAYWEMGSLGPVTAYENLETAEAHLIADGIEALAALAVLDTLQIRIAKMESSGTNEYQRGSIDWDKLRAKLQAQVARATDLLNPTEAGGAGGGPLFVLATISDDFSG
ncbi:hypothetical protein [Sphingopyxis flava]|uniref:Uncharacterized protein n=1 Tax=Sphingopyxis flava TaxID=1507287 RepID=A0A1T5CSA1_9SPHN|nr:hypothetical protein [Sphingopyxis flava]SKB62349.1 hypothetical protein SAMN06295937_101172 [Sphingopyxis flava]